MWNSQSPIIASKKAKGQAGTSPKPVPNLIYSEPCSQEAGIMLLGRTQFKNLCRIEEIYAQIQIPSRFSTNLLTLNCMKEEFVYMVVGDKI